MHWHKNGIGHIARYSYNTFVDGQKDVKTGDQEIDLEPQDDQQEYGEVT